MIIEGYVHETGKSCRTVAIMNLLHCKGLDITENVVFGLCEGFNFAYVMPSNNSEHSQMKIICPNLNQFENLAKNMGLEYKIMTENDINMKNIENIIRYENAPVIAEVALEQYKEYLGEDGEFLNNFDLDIPISLHISEVVGIDESFIYTYENFSTNLFKIPREVFGKARKLESHTGYNPFHKIYRLFLPEDLKDLDFNMVLKNAIINNMDSYINSQNDRMGYTAFKKFIRDYHNLKQMLPNEIIDKSLTNCGYLIKYVSAGLFRKSYSRFLTYCGLVLQHQTEFDELTRLLNKSDYLWNILAAIMINKDLSLNDKLFGAKVVKIIKELDRTESQFINKIGDVIDKWNI